MDGDNRSNQSVHSENGALQILKGAMSPRSAIKNIVLDQLINGIFYQSSTILVIIRPYQYCWNSQVVLLHGVSELSDQKPH